METNAEPISNRAGGMMTPVYSTFQTDSVSLKLRWPVSWALRDARGISWMQNVTW